MKSVLTLAMEGVLSYCTVRRNANSNRDQPKSSVTWTFLATSLNIDCLFSGYLSRYNFLTAFLAIAISLPIVFLCFLAINYPLAFLLWPPHSLISDTFSLLLCYSFMLPFSHCLSCYCFLTVSHYSLLSLSCFCFLLHFLCHFFSQWFSLFLAIAISLLH